MSTTPTGNSQTWENTRKHARALETRLDAKLASYSKVASQISQGSSSGAGRGADYSRREELGMEEEGLGGYKLIEEEIEELLEKLSETLDSLSSILNNPSLPPSTSMLIAAQRHRDILDDYRRDFGRTKSNVESALQRNNLLGSIRQDINAYKSSLPSSSPGNGKSATDALLSDRGRIDSSNRMLDETLSQAYATRDDFAQQSTMLAKINSRMGGVLSTIPGINSLLNMINSRRRRDTVIIGLVVGACTLLLLIYLTGW